MRQLRLGGPPSDVLSPLFVLCVFHLLRFVCRRLVFHLCPVVCVRSRAASGPAGLPRGVLCPSGVRPDLLRAVVKTPIRSERTPDGR